MRYRASRLAALCAAAATLALPAMASARTQVVYAGGPSGFQHSLLHRYSAEVLDFFPHSVTINVGDTIRWEGMSIDGHTIDLPGQSGKPLPLFLPRADAISGSKDAAGKPFWFNGRSNLSFNPLLFPLTRVSTYSGSARVDSGLPYGPPRTLSVQFLKPGRYAYFDDSHYGTRGIIVVLPQGKQVPSAKQDAKAVAEQVARDTEVAKRLAKTKVLGDRVSLGKAGRDNVEVLAMFPSTLHVKTGATVAFAVSSGTSETHTATFGPASYLKPLADSFNSPLFDPRGVYPSSPTTPIPLNPTSHGNGFANIGPLDRDSATSLPSGSKIKFTKPGRYHYICLIHEFMHGTIIVKG